MQKTPGVQRIINAAGYSFAGLRAAFNSEEAFRQEVYLSAVAFPFIIWCNVTNLEKLLMIGSIFLVFISELVNTAIESIVNRISEEIHPLSKQAKDIGSAVVLLAFSNLVIVWFVILI